MNEVSPEIFETISLLKPYDIDKPKVRLGNERDGAYILADIGGLGDVLSFGVGPNISFEHDMALAGRRVFMHDHTVGSLPMDHLRFRFSPRGICGEGQSSPELAPLSEHVRAIGDLSARAILKIDVEGWEWEVFSTISQEQLEQFDQITVEVHWLERLKEPDFLRNARTSLHNINTQFTLFHVHANNCAGMYIVGGFPMAGVLELSYVRTSLVSRSPSRTIYPSSLNKANRPDWYDYPLLFYPFSPALIDDFKNKEMVNRVVTDYRLP